jgi:uncharacterized OsmC-like protein
MSDSSRPTVTLRQIEDYKFDIAFGPAWPHLTCDEAPPLGTGQGPQPVHLLLAAAANCMSDSLHFALRKFRQDGQGISTRASAVIGRNHAGRLRVLEIEIEITLGADADSLQHLDRILAQFEDFCTVGASIRAGVPIALSVRDGKGRRLK